MIALTLSPIAGRLSASRGCSATALASSGRSPIVSSFARGRSGDSYHSHAHYVQVVTRPVLPPWFDWVGPHVGLGDLQHVACGVLEVERARARRPLDLLRELDAFLRQAPLPRLVLAGRREEARVDARIGGAVRRRRMLDGRFVGIEEQEHAAAETMRDASLAQRLQPEHVAVEAPRRFLVLSCAVDDGLEDAGQ